LSHAVHFYEDDFDLTAHIMAYIDSGIRAGSSVIVIARTPFLERLKARWLPLHADRFISLDAAETLSKLLHNDRLDRERFMQVIGTLVRGVTDRTRHVYIFGEMVAILWGDQKYDAELELEDLWNELASRVPLTLLCAYPAAAFEENQTGQRRICDAHYDLSIQGNFPEPDTGVEGFAARAETSR